MNLRAVRALAAVGLTMLLAGGCATGSSPSSESGAVRAASPNPPAKAAHAPTRVEKLLVFVIENHSFDQMRDEMPFTFGLAQHYGYAKHYQALAHPSLPNYLAMTGGSTFGVINDDPPSVNGIHGPSVFGQAIAAGRSAGLYAEGMTDNCATINGGDRYAVRHNPWVYHLDERASCAKFDVPLTRLAPDVAAGNLPVVGMAIPNVCHDAHDCDLATADAWLRQQINTVMSGPDWASGHLAIVVTADEDDSDHDNRILTVVAHPALDGRVVSTSLSHLSLARSYSEVAGLPPLAGAANAPSLLEAFGLTTG